MINNNNIYINILSRDGANSDKLKLMDIRDMGKKLMAGSVKGVIGARRKGRRLITPSQIGIADVSTYKASCCSQGWQLGENPDPGHFNKQRSV